MDTYIRQKSLEDYLDEYRKAAQLDNIDQHIQHVAHSIESLHADFNWAMGELCYKVELQQQTLQAILFALQSPLSTQARELRQRAEFAYQSGWYDEALNDFLESERHNYQDFAVHQAIGNIYLYHCHPPKLTDALNYYLKAAKFARPHSAYYAAVNYMFAGFVCYVLKDDEAAIQHAAMAIQLYPRLTEAIYNHAKFSAAANKADISISSLEKAIRADANYVNKARADGDFASVATAVTSLLTKLNNETKGQAQAEIINLEQELTTLVFFHKAVEVDIINLLKQAKALLVHNTYSASLDAKDTIRTARHLLELRKCIPGEEGHCYFQSHGHHIGDFTLSPSLSLLALKHDNKVSLFEIPSTGHIKHVFKLPDRATKVKFSPNGSLMAVISYSETRVWDVRTFQLVSTLNFHYDAQCLAFSPDGSMLAVGRRGEGLRLYDVTTGRLIRTHADHWGWSVAFSPDGSVLAAGGIGKTTLWDTATGKQIHSLQEESHYSVDEVKFSPDGTLLATGSKEIEKSGLTVRLWNRATGQVIQTLQNYWLIGFSFNSSVLYTSSGYGSKPSIVVWNIAKGQIIDTLPSEGSKHYFLPDGLYNVMNDKDTSYRVVINHSYYQIMSADLVGALNERYAERYFVDAELERHKQDGVWFRKSYDEAIRLYERAAALGHEEARLMAEQLRSKQ